MAGRSARWRPVIVRTGGSAREGVYGLILALSVIAVASEYGPADAGQVAVEVLVTALVFWLAHVYSDLLAARATAQHEVTRAVAARSLREEWSIVEVVIPLLVVLVLGALGATTDRTAINVAVGMALLELGWAGGYAARTTDPRPLRTLLSAATSVAFGLAVVALKAIVH